MEERGLARIDRIEAGNDVVFNMNPHAPEDPGLAVLVSLQTDYAAWIGARSFFGNLD